MTISSYVLFISPPIYIEGGKAGSLAGKQAGQEDNTLDGSGIIGRQF